MKNINLLLFAFLLLVFTKTSGQPGVDYTPTKESVPDISRYDALLSLKSDLLKCPLCFTRIIGDYFKLKRRDLMNGDYDRLLLNNISLISEGKFELNFKSGNTQGPLPPWFIEFSSLAVPNARIHDKKYYICFQLLQPTTGFQLWLDYESYEMAKQVVDAIYILKTRDQNEENSKELESFKLIAQQYQSLLTKPALNEEARRFLVQATTATEEKSYEEAIKLLEKALIIEPAYPQAHFNLALLWAQVNIYGAAILEMKKYLMLVPDAPDARASQDKIYEWERKLNK